MYDLIGDIHGYATVLKKLLKKLGYKRKNGAFRCPNRKVIFVGDYIDRGPEIPDTLHLVRSMVDAGEAIALMGNHEFNAILFNEPKEQGGYLRPRSFKNITQHLETLRQFKGKRETYETYIEWFKSLPLYFENKYLRTIHACWDNKMIRELQEYLSDSSLGVIEPEYFCMAGDRDTRVYTLVDTLLKGKEVELPNGKSFKDKDGNQRKEARIKWWLNPQKSSFGEWCMNEVGGLGDKRVDSKYHTDSHYKRNYIPVFFGHYWLNGTPALQRPNVCCLDYSIGKKDKLVAYRYNGEKKLRQEQFEWVSY